MIWNVRRPFGLDDYIDDEVEADGWKIDGGALIFLNDPTAEADAEADRRAAANQVPRFPPPRRFVKAYGPRGWLTLEPESTP